MGKNKHDKPEKDRERETIVVYDCTSGSHQDSLVHGTTNLYQCQRCGRVVGT